MQQLKIKVNVANRVYPRTINRNDEEGVRNAVKNIANRLKIYEAKFEARDTQDLLSKCLLEMAIKLIGDEQKVKVDSSFEDQLLEIESYIDSNL